MMMDMWMMMIVMMMDMWMMMMNDADINISHIFLLPAVLVINPPTVKKIALLGILQ